MPLRALAFIIGFVLTTGLAIWMPLAGVLGYVAHYNLGPERQWWNAALRPLNIRYSYTLAIVTAVGIALNHARLRWGAKLLHRHEWLMLLFLGAVWLSLSASGQIRSYEYVDHPALKFAKVIVFVLMLTHVVTRIRDLDALIWVLVLGGLVLGVQAYNTPRSAFYSGRLETVGGPDFTEANTLAVYLGTVLPLIGFQFLRSKWIGKIICLVAGAFTANAIILTRSRGVLVGLAAGAVAVLIMAPRKYRMVIAAGMIVAFIGGYFLTDPQFRDRASTIVVEGGERDRSAQSRFEIWEGGWRMIKANPVLGVGAANFQHNIGRYQPLHPGRDAHNTYIRCAAETGLLGFGVFVAIIVNALWMIRQAMREAAYLPPKQRDEVVHMSLALLVSTITMLACGLTGSLVFIESFWWFLALPVCLWRATENLKRDHEEALAAGAGTAKAAPKPEPIIGGVH